MKKRKPSQLMDLFLSIADALGLSEDRDIAALAEVGSENVAGWRAGSVKEFKIQTFAAAKRNLLEHLRMLSVNSGVMLDDQIAALSALEIEDGSNPTDLHRQFRNRVHYDYLGHRFLYFEAQGALAWENLIKAGYEQECWLQGVRECARRWLSTKRDQQGNVSGPIARSLRLDRRDGGRGLEIISLGPGEGGKECTLLAELMGLEQRERLRTAFVNYVPVDVSIPLLLGCARGAKRVIVERADAARRPFYAVNPVCADFEEGPLAFAERLRTRASDGLRLVVILGNVLGNLRDESAFVRQKLWRLTRRGDLVWLEVGLRPDRIESDPLFRMTENSEESAGEANRRLLLEGPYRRFVAALGRPTPNLGLRIWLREDDESTSVPGSCNFCHDLILKDEGRSCTMLFSRRYALQELSGWLEALDFDVVGIQKTLDSKQRPRVGHLLLQRRGEVSGQHSRRT